MLVVGHQPTLGSIAAKLLGTAHESFRIKKCGLWWFSRNEDASEVLLRLVITPDFL